MTEEPRITRMRELGTTSVSDALDRLGIAGQCLGIMPLERSFRLLGRAFTIRYVAADGRPGTVGDYIDDLGPGDVVVLDNQGRPDATVWGDLLTSTAHRRGVAGTVIDGICRDIDRSIQLHYPIFSRGHWMRTGKDRVRLDAKKVAVSIGGVRVEAGDYLLGDGDGVVAIPVSRIDEVIEAAREIAAAEESIRKAVERGKSRVDIEKRRPIVAAGVAIEVRVEYSQGQIERSVHVGTQSPTDLRDALIHKLIALGCRQMAPLLPYCDRIRVLGAPSPTTYDTASG